MIWSAQTLAALAHGVVSRPLAPLRYAQSNRLSSSLTDNIDLRSHSRPHVGQLLREALISFESSLAAGLERAGIEGMRPRYNAVLRHLDENGTRATVLAQRAGLTRQALTQTVDELEAAGLVERREDPSDRRAKLVVYTEPGHRGYLAARRVISEIEHEYEARLGARRYRQLRAALGELLGDD